MKSRPPFPASSSNPHKTRPPFGAGGAVDDEDPLGGGGFDITQLWNYLRIVREHWLLGLSVGLVLGLGFAFLTLRKTPLYQTASLLLIESRAAQVIEVDEVMDTSLSGYVASELNNHLRQLASRAYIKRVADSFSETERELIIQPYRVPMEPDPSVAGIVGGAISVTNDAQIFTIAATHRDPAAAQLIANRYAESYIRFMASRAGTSTASAMTFLEQQAEDLRKTISEKERRLTDYRMENNLVSLEESQNIIVERLQSINSALTAARVERFSVESLANQVASARENPAADLTALPTIATYGAVPDILSRLKEAESARAALDLRYLERHPKMIQIEEQLAQIRGQLDREVDRAMTDLTNRQQALDGRMTLLAQELARAEAEALELDRKGVEYGVLRRELESDRRTFDAIVARLSETNLASQLDTTNFRILDTAFLPAAPISPEPKKAAMGAVALFGLCFFGIPFLIELVDNRLRSAYDVETFVQKPLLADLPFLKRVEKQEISPLVVLKDADDMTAEGFRSAFSGLQMYGSTEYPRTVLITSTRPSEGKSFVVSNLACTTAKHGVRTLIIDCDFRRPTLHKYFERRNDRGILAWFHALQDGKHALSDAPLTEDPFLAIESIAPRLDFLRAGGSTKKTTELIGSNEFERLLRELRGHYDLILLDTPPISVFTDALFLSEFAEEVIYVARFNQVSRQKVRHYVGRLDGPHEKVLGVILNGRTSTRGQRHGYDYNYSYYNSDYKYYKTYHTHEDKGQGGPLSSPSPSSDSGLSDGLRALS